MRQEPHAPLQVVVDLAVVGLIVGREHCRVNLGVGHFFGAVLELFVLVHLAVKDFPRGVTLGRTGFIFVLHFT